MLAAYVLFLVPTLLFVVAFLYETYLSFRRLGNPEKGRSGYVNATWEVTHTLLVFAVVMLVMMFTKDIEGLSSAIFTSTFLAASALIVRSITYAYIFYVRTTGKISWIDWLFALTHVAAAVFLVITVIKATLYLYTHDLQVNSQFLPYFIPGLVLVLAVCIVPVTVLYKSK